MAYRVEGIPEAVYKLARVNFRGRLPWLGEKVNGWDPWVKAEDARELLEEVKRRVEVREAEWSDKTQYRDMAAPAQRAVDRWQMKHMAGRGRLYGVAIGGKWAVAPVEREAICRAVLYAITQTWL